MVRKIDSPRNDYIKSLVRLHRGRHRRRAGRFLVEGIRPLQLAEQAGRQPVEVLYNPKGLHPAEVVLLEKWREVPAVEVSPSVMRALSVREAPGGLVAVMPWRLPSLNDFSLVPQGVYLVAASVEKPGNLGALFRNADGAGCSALLIANPIVDPFHPQVIRNSQGTVFSVPWVVGETAAMMHRLRREGIAVAVATPEATVPLWEAELEPPVAVVVGTEHAGVPPPWKEAADVRFSIPMYGRIDSLNVSVSAALALYEVRRRMAAAGKQ